MIKLNQMNHWMILSVVMALLSSQAWGAAGVTYHGRLLKPNGRPVSASNVQFRLQIRTPAPNSCLLYEEIHVRDLSQTQGVFSITLNDGALSKGGEFSLWESFRIHGEFSFLPGRCSIDSNYTANISDGRQLFVSFNDGSFSDWEPLPAQEIAFVPFSLEAMSVNGRKAESFFRVEDAGVPQVMPPWDSAKYLKLQNLVNAVGAANGMTISGGSVSIGGTAAGFTGSLGGDVTGTQGATKVEKLQGRTVLDAVPAQGQVLTWSHANSRWEPANLPAAGAPSGGASGDLTGDYPGPTIANNAVTGAKIADGAVGFGKIAPPSSPGVPGQVFTWDGSNWSAGLVNYMSLVKSGGGSPWPATACLTGEAIIWQSATDGFECATISVTETDPLVKSYAKADPSSDFETTGGVLALKTVPVSKGGTGAVTASTALNNLLPPQGAHAGKLLQTDGVSVSWGDAPSTGVDSINGATAASQTFTTAQSGDFPMFSTLGSTHTLSIPLASTSGVVSGTISHGDYTLFSGKQAALGFVPLNPGNNLSELTNTTTARINLGLGSAATRTVGVVAGNLVEVGGGNRIPASLIPDQSSIYFAQGGNDFGSMAVLGTTTAQPLHLQTNGAHRLTISDEGKVGIGIATPEVALDVAGGVKVANDSSACNSVKAGTLRWTGSAFEGCNGSAWVALIAGGGTSIKLKAIRQYSSSTTWSRPTGLDYVVVEIWGAGGGGGSAYYPGTAGGASMFGAHVSALGGGAGASSSGGGGGSSGGDVSLVGGNGVSGLGGDSPRGGKGGLYQVPASFPGGGGWGGYDPTGGGFGTGAGGGGGYAQKRIDGESLSPTVAVTIGSGGSGGALGSGLPGASGLIIVYEYGL